MNIKLLLFSLLTFVSINNMNACDCDPLSFAIKLEQLKVYDFIAHVKITAVKTYNNNPKNKFEDINQLDFEIIELFKGDTIKNILELGISTSCVIGVDINEEWILFGKTIDGHISIGVCDRNQKYKDSSGLRFWQLKNGFRELEQLRNLYHHPIKKFENEKHVEYYSNGQIEIEETYVNGRLSGDRKIWYPNGILHCQQFYINDSIDGKSLWFYPSGQISDEKYYSKNEPINVFRTYYDTSYLALLYEEFDFNKEDSCFITCHKIQIQYEIVFDAYGRSIISREFKRNGKLFKEETRSLGGKLVTHIYYYDNGNISSIGYVLNGKNHGHYQTYNEDGTMDRGWDYDDNGEIIIKE